MHTTKRKKEDLVQARNAVGQTKLCFAKRSKIIDKVSGFSSFALRSFAKLLFFQFKSNRRHCMCNVTYILFRILTESYPYFPVYGQNLQCKRKYGHGFIHIRKNTDLKKLVF